MNQFGIRIARAVTVALCLVIAGCDDGGGLGTGNKAGQIDCSPVPPCGGDIRGSWTPVGSCGDPICPGYTLDNSMASLAVTFADGKVSWSATGTQRATYPLSCLQVDGGVPFSCAQLGATTGVTCQIVNNVCSCTTDFSKVTFPGPGNYSVSNGKLTFGSGAGSPSMDYCITGDRLRLSSARGFGMGMGQGSVVEYARKK